jgi:CheY-like chemotaxis protein
MGKLPTVLIVDDAPEMIEILGGLFEESGFQVITAQSAKEGLSVFDMWKTGGRVIDLVTIDMRMPETDGLTLARMLREAGFSGPMVAFTSNVTGAAKKSSGAVGIDAYFSKSVVNPDLIQAIKTRFCEGG